MAQLAFVFFLQLVAGLVGWWLQSWPGVVVGVAVAGAGVVLDWAATVDMVQNGAIAIARGRRQRRGMGA